MEERDGSNSRRSFFAGKKKKTKFRDCSKVNDSGIWVGSCRGTQFSPKEIKERASLFKCEYNQEDLHDRVLVVQVMPDDYEMLELTARLNESTRTDKLLVSEEIASEEKEKLGNADACEESALNVDNYRSQESNGFDTNASSASQSKDDETTFYREPTRREGTESISIREEENYTDVVDSCCDYEVIVKDTNNAELSVKGNYKMKSEESDNESPQEVINIDNRVPTPDEIMEIYSEADEGFPENVSQSISETGSHAFVDVAINSSKKPEFKCKEYEPATSSRKKNESSPDDVNDLAIQLPCAVHVLREHRVYVHACWLAVNSSYFRSLLFESGMRECSNTEFCMKVAESDEEGFMLLLQSIYDPDVLDNLDITPLMNVLRLSAKYDVRFPSVKARRVLETTPLAIDVCESIIEAVDSGGLPDLGGVMNNVREFLINEFKPLDETWESEKFSSLSIPALSFLLSSDWLVVQSENTVFIALMKWIEKNAEVYDNCITEYSDLLKLVRFDIMKPTYIYDVVREHPIATQLDGFDTVYLKAITHHALPQRRREMQVSGRQWCEPNVPTFMWILYPEPEMFSFDQKSPRTSTKSSSFWYFGYKMYLQLDLTTVRDNSGLYLVIENLSQDGSVEIAYDVDVKFGDILHKSFTVDRFVYQDNDLSPAPLNYPFNDNYAVDEIREILLGGSMKVAITFEVTAEKLKD